MNKNNTADADILERARQEAFVKTEGGSWDEVFDAGRDSVIFPPLSEFRDKFREMICEGDFDFTKIFEEIQFEGETYTDISNEGADALADYFLNLFEMIDEWRSEQVGYSRLAEYEKGDAEIYEMDTLRFHAELLSLREYFYRIGHDHMAVRVEAVLKAQSPAEGAEICEEAVEIENKDFVMQQARHNTEVFKRMGLIDENGDFINPVQPAEDGGWRMDAPPSEDVVISTMIHFANTHLAEAERKLGVYKEVNSYYEKALQHYANDNNWLKYPGGNANNDPMRLYEDSGVHGYARARAALLFAQAAIREAEGE